MMSTSRVHYYLSFHITKHGKTLYLLRHFFVYKKRWHVTSKMDAFPLESLAGGNSNREKSMPTQLAGIGSKKQNIWGEHIKDKILAHMESPIIVE